MFRTPANLPAQNYYSPPLDPSPTPPANTGTPPVPPTFAQTQANRVEAFVKEALEKKRVEGVSTELTPGVSVDCRTHVNNRLRETAKKLQSKIDAQKMATEMLGERTSYGITEATRILAEKGQDPSTNPEVFNQLINHCEGMWDKAIEEKADHIQQYGKTDEQLRQSFLTYAEYAILATHGERQQYAEAQAKLKIHWSGRNPDTEDPSALREEIAAMAQAWDEMAGNEALRFARQFENTPKYVQQAFISHATSVVTAAYGDQQTYAEQAAHQKLMMDGVNPEERPEDFHFQIDIHKQLWHQRVAHEAQVLMQGHMNKATLEWEQSVKTYAAALPRSPQSPLPGAGTGTKGRAMQLQEAYRAGRASSSTPPASSMQVFSFGRANPALRQIPKEHQDRFEELVAPIRQHAKDQRKTKQEKGCMNQLENVVMNLNEESGKPKISWDAAVAAYLGGFQSQFPRKIRKDVVRKNS